MGDHASVGGGHSRHERPPPFHHKARPGDDSFRLRFGLWHSKESDNLPANHRFNPIGNDDKGVGGQRSNLHDTSQEGPSKRVENGQIHQPGNKSHEFQSSGDLPWLVHAALGSDTISASLVSANEAQTSPRPDLMAGRAPIPDGTRAPDDDALHASGANATLQGAQGADRQGLAHDQGVQSLFAHPTSVVDASDFAGRGHSHPIAQQSTSVASLSDHTQITFTDLRPALRLFSIDGKGSPHG
jgi:hypothetical protein